LALATTRRYRDARAVGFDQANRAHAVTGAFVAPEYFHQAAIAREAVVAELSGTVATRSLSLPATRRDWDAAPYSRLAKRRSRTTAPTVADTSRGLCETRIASGAVVAELKRAVAACPLSVGTAGSDQATGLGRVEKGIPALAVPAAAQHWREPILAGVSFANAAGALIQSAALGTGNVR
jgi:hypothetical protein